MIERRELIWRLKDLAVIIDRHRNDCVWRNDIPTDKDGKIDEDQASSNMEWNDELGDMIHFALELKNE